MSRKITLLVSVLMLLNLGCLFAQQVNQYEALERAKFFRGSNNTSMKARGAFSISQSMQLVYTGGDPANPAFYIYNVGKDNGFVIVAADERMEPILAYSLSGSFDAENIIPEVQSILDGYAEDARLLRTAGEKKTAKRTAAKQITPLAAIVQTGPLLGKIAWNQMEPYNNDCPIVNGKRSVTGCVATATGQIMKYHAYPPKGTGTVSGIVLGNYSYDWNLMLPTYPNPDTATDEQKAEVAKLMLHIGRSVNMDYNSDGSASDNRLAARALKNNFYYSQKIEAVRREVYTDDEWLELIRSEIDAKRPILYDGMGQKGGHAFVCDGYDSAGKIHLNYGWGGIDNGFYTLAKNQFPYSNQIIIGITPKETAVAVSPQVSLVSSINASAMVTTKGKTVSFAAKITNYGLAGFNDNLGVAVYQNDELVKVLKTSKTSVALNEFQKDPKNIKTQNLNFNNVTIPTSLSNGSYQLYFVSYKDGIPFRMPAANSDLIGCATRYMDMEVSGNNVTFSYPIGDNGVSLELSQKLEMSVANNMGVARFSLKNPDDEYDFDGNVYILGRKSGDLISTVYATQSVTVYSEDSIDVVIKDIPLQIGSYTFYVATNSKNMESTGIGATPLLPAALNFYTYDVPTERQDYAVDFTKLKKLPDGYKQYKDKDENEFILTGVASHDNYAPWRYVGVIKWAESYLLPKASQSSNPTGLIHTLVSEPISVSDENGVLNWTLYYMNKVKYQVFVTTKGQGLNDFDESDLVYSDTIDTEKNQGNMDVRLSLAKYAGQKVYIVFRHFLSEEDTSGSTLQLQTLKLLNIPSPKDISVNSISLPERVVVGEKLPVTVSVRNHSAINVTGFTANFTLGDKTYSQAFGCNIGYDQLFTFTYDDLPLEGVAGDNLQVKVDIEMPGEDASLLGNNTKTAKTLLLSFMPEKNMVVYETSKQGCAGCMVAYTKLDELEESYPAQFAGVTLWINSSPEGYSCNEFSSFFSEETPSAFVNNKSVNSAVGEVIVTGAIAAFKNLQPISTVSVESAFKDKGSRTMTVKVKARFALPLTGTYRLGAFITESNVVTKDYPIYGGNPSGNLRTKNYMPIATVGGARGATGYAITNPECDKDYVYEFEYTLPDETAIRNKKENVQVIGLLFDSKGNIDNSSLDCYYVRIPKTDGLAFVAEDGYCPFKEVNEVKVKDATTLNTTYKSVVEHRATIPARKDFRFRIQKDATIGDKKIKVLVNKKANKETEVELIPDLDGAYTLKNVEQYYYLDIEVLDQADDRPLAVKNGTELSLSRTWQPADFARLDLTDATLTGVDMTNIVIPESAKELNPANPNLLVYVADDAVVPTSWANVVKGGFADRIELKDGFAFYNSKEFRADNISYARTYPKAGWSSMCLPFSVQVADLAKAGISLEEYTGSNNDMLNFKPVTTEATIANTPYIAKITEVGEVSLSSAGALIPVSEVNAVEDNDYTFKGAFLPIGKGAAKGLFFLNPTGEGFVRGTASSDIPAFRSYVEYTGSSVAAQKLGVHRDNTTAMQQTGAEEDLFMYVSGGNLVIVAAGTMNVNVCTIDGKTVRRLQVQQGDNVIGGLAKGLYLVNNKKVSIQ